MDELPVLQDFLQNFPFDVAPRSSEGLSNELTEQLEALSGGDLAGQDLDGLARDILSNPEALEFLAKLAKERQGQSETAG